MCVSGRGTAERICSFLCAARQPELILPHAARRHHYAEEFPAVSAAAAAARGGARVLDGEREGEETCCKATLTDRGRGWLSHWILHEDVQRSFTGKSTLFMGFIADFCPRPKLRMYVRGNTVYLCVRACE